MDTMAVKFQIDSIENSLVWESHSTLGHDLAVVSSNPSQHSETPLTPEDILKEMIAEYPDQEAADVATCMFADSISQLLVSEHCLLTNEEKPL